jgi:MFS family permease
MLQSFALAALALTHLITVAEIAALQLFQGLINAFDTPARQAFVVEMVEDRRDLANAIALNSSMFNGARLVGPSIGGVLIALVGEGGCFLVDGVSYLAVIASLLAMTVKPSAPRGEQKRVLQELREGWRYTAGSPPIRSMLMLLGIVSLVGMPYAVLMPVIASVRLHGGAHTLGFLMAAVGLGALGGAVSLAMRRSVVGLGRVIVGMAICFGLSLAAFAASRQLWLSLPSLVAVGYSMMLQTASTNTVLQTILEERMRGRVMAFYTMAVMGTAPFGSLLAGALADRIGAPWTIAGGGLLCAGAAGYFATQLPRLREHVRPIYQRLGILPEVAEGLRAAQDVSTPAA